MGMKFAAWTLGLIFLSFWVVILWASVMALLTDDFSHDPLKVLALQITLLSGFIVVGVFALSVAGYTTLGRVEENVLSKVERDLPYMIAKLEDERGRRGDDGIVQKGTVSSKEREDMAENPEASA